MTRLGTLCVLNLFLIFKKLFFKTRQWTYKLFNLIILNSLIKKFKSVIITKIKHLIIPKKSILKFKSIISNRKIIAQNYYKFLIAGLRNVIGLAVTIANAKKIRQIQQKGLVTNISFL